MTKLPNEPGEAAGTDEDTRSEGASDPVDLKATITLSGEELAALLEQVKQVRADAGEQQSRADQFQAEEGDQQGDERARDDQVGDKT